MVFEATIWTDVWGETPVPKSYLGPRRFIRARASWEASEEAKKRWPHAKQITVRPVTKVRTFLIHLNVEVPEGDTRSLEQIVELIDGALDVGLSGHADDPIMVAFALSEEVT